MTGERWNPSGRIPRELRLREYQYVTALFGVTEVIGDRIPVAVEIVPGAERLESFVHPENAVYIFGPEDGSLGKEMLSRCHRFVVIPSDFCLNLACAVSCVLMHRRMQLGQMPG